MAAADSGGDCPECRAIARELSEAYAEAWAAMDEAEREAATAFYMMIGGDEEDAAKAQEMTARTQFRDTIQVRRLRQALQRGWAHLALTGHKMRTPWS